MKNKQKILLTAFVLIIAIAISLFALTYSKIDLTYPKDDQIFVSNKSLPEYVVLSEGENIIKSNGQMEMIIKIPDEEGGRGEERKTRVMTRYVYSHDRDYLPSRYFVLHLDEAITGNMDKNDYSLEPLGNNSYKVILTAPKAPGKYEVSITSPVQKYEITVVDKISTKEDLYPLLYQYMFIEKHIINSLKSVNISLKNVVLKGDKWKMKYLTEFEKNGVDWDMGKVFKYSVKGDIVIDANTGRVLEDTHSFSDKLP